MKEYPSRDNEGRENIGPWVGGFSFEGSAAARRQRLPQTLPKQPPTPSSACHHLNPYSRCISFQHTLFLRISAPDRVTTPSTTIVFFAHLHLPNPPGPSPPEELESPNFPTLGTLPLPKHPIAQSQWPTSRPQSTRSNSLFRWIPFPFRLPMAIPTAGLASPVPPPRPARTRTRSGLSSMTPTTSTSSTPS